MSIPIPAGPDIAGKTCPGCRTPIQAGAAVAVCPNCGNPHHALCWQRTNGCAVYGCTQRAAVAPTQRPGGQVAACPKCGYIFGPMETTCRRCAAGGGAMRTEMARKPVKSSGASPWAVTVIVLIALGIIGAVGYLALSKRDGSIVLAYRFRPGQVDSYALTGDITMHLPKTPVLPSSIDMHISGRTIQKVLSVKPDGSATVETTLKDGRISSSNPLLGGDASIPDKTSVCTISRTGKEVKVGDEASAVAELGMGMPGLDKIGGAATLPEKGVNVGESWTETVKGSNGVELEITSKLMSIAEMLGRRKTQRIEQTYKSDFNLSDMMNNSGASMPFMTSGKCKLTGKGTVYFCQDEGRVVQENVDMKIEFTISSGGMFGSSAEMSMDFKVNVALAE